MNCKVISFNEKSVLKQNLPTEVLTLENYQQIENLRTELVVILPKGCNFYHQDALQQLLKDLENNEYAVGVYADSMINNLYKAHLPFGESTIQLEKIKSGLLVKKSALEDLTEINGTEKLIKRIAEKFLLYRSPNILFKYEV